MALEKLAFEASEFLYNNGYDRHRMLYHYTYHNKRFSYVNTEYDREGEVTVWNYRASDGQMLVLFND